jgi:hypothetical protein
MSFRFLKLTANNAPTHRHAERQGVCWEGGGGSASGSLEPKYSLAEGEQPETLFTNRASKGVGGFFMASTLEGSMSGS